MVNDLQMVMYQTCVSERVLSTHLDHYSRRFPQLRRIPTSLFPYHLIFDDSLKITDSYLLVLDAIKHILTTKSH